MRAEYVPKTSYIAPLPEALFNSGNIFPVYCRYESCFTDLLVNKN